MKKLILIGGIACLVLASCKKQHTCVCTLTTTTPGGTVTVDPAITTTYTKIKKSDAREHCISTTSQTNQTAPSVSTGDTKDTKCTLN